ncbi:hypothetical protein [Methylobacterium pseudosasicola]|uniref:hypothetical protein n=1 Tax=Methylobacterium pseudosasicola TaxID=582667 RepID=UPI0011140332|nr:hypothetical protein [Methylobacterium pseudosasicola]
MPVDPVQVLLGGFLGFAGAGALRWWQYRRDLWISEIERFTDALNEACDLSTEYWLCRKSDDKEIIDKDKALELLVQEAKLLGFQIRLDGLQACFIDRLLRDDRKSINSKMSDLSSALTGGSFQSKERDADPDRAILIQATAADLLIEMRQSVRRSLSISGTLRASAEKFSIRAYNMIVMRHHAKRKIEW